MAGVDDNFEAPPDDAAYSTVLSTVIRYRWEIQDFDLTIGLNEGLSNRWIAHTFSDLPPGIVSATLEFRIKGGEDPNASNDDFWLLFYDVITPEFDTDKGAYRVAIGDRGATTQGLAGMEWEPGSVATLSLDLSALPLPDGRTISVMEDLENFGFIDVLVTDDTAVDFYQLTVLPTTIDDILNLFDDSVESDELYGYGTGWLAELRLLFMRLLLVIAGEFIENDRINGTCIVLQRALLRCDGEPGLRDFVEGPTTGGIAEMIVDLMENHACE